MVHKQMGHPVLVEVMEYFVNTNSIPAKVFSGRTNSIALTRRYSQEHSCKFDLYYFPFDAQVTTE